MRGALTDPGSNPGTTIKNKKTPHKVVFFDSWQSQYDNFRTILSANYAEIMENLNAFEEFLNSIQSVGNRMHQI